MKTKDKGPDGTKSEASKKRKRADPDDDEPMLDDVQDNDDPAAPEVVTAQEEPEAEAEEPAKPKKKRQRGGKKGKKAADSTSGPRLTVFVGNLPSSANNDSVRAHFAAFSPVGVRVLNDKDRPTACRGCAFVDFDTGSHMRTALDRLHQSSFEDGVSRPHKLNLELTAGGGGNGGARLDKLRDKNRLLNVNRARKVETEKMAREMKEGEKMREQRRGKQQQQGNVHPSRQGQVKTQPRRTA